MASAPVECNEVWSVYKVSRSTCISDLVLTEVKLHEAGHVFEHTSDCRGSWSAASTDSSINWWRTGVGNHCSHQLEHSQLSMPVDAEGLTEQLHALVTKWILPDMELQPKAATVSRRQQQR